MTSPTLYVIMVDMSFRITETTEEQKGQEFDPSDNDGRKLQEVGWMKIKLFNLMP
jgi:hypothetical protein